jgi:hypothetical protein
MVGEKPKVHWIGIMKPKEKKQTFADFTGQFTNKDYKQGGFDCNGYDCLGLVYDFLTKKGNNIPDSFDGLTKENYYVLFNTNKLAAIKKMFEYFDLFAERINIHERMAGDIVMVQKETEDKTFPAIYVGNGNILACYYDCGVKVLACREPFKVVRAWRVK